MLRSPPMHNFVWQRAFAGRHTNMKTTFALALLLFLSVATAHAQEKGVDQQNDRIRDNGNSRAPAVNGGKLDTGAGRGIDFGRGRTFVPPPLANPYRLTTREDAVVQAVVELMAERKLILDDTVSKPEQGVLVSQPFTFFKGAVVAQSELNRLAEVPVTEGRGWTRGRYTIVVEVQPVDGANTNVSVNAKVEGRTDGAVGAEWLTLRSNGVAEEEFLLALIEKITGAPPPGREQP